MYKNQEQGCGLHSEIESCCRKTEIYELKFENNATINEKAISKLK